VSDLKECTPLAQGQPTNTNKLYPVELELTTKRLTLRPLSINDVGLAIEMFTDEQVMEYSGGAVAKENIVEKMEMWTRRGGNGCIGVSVIELREKVLAPPP